MPKPHRSEDAASLSRNWQPFRLPTTAPSRALIDGIISEIEAEEERQGLRKRRRKGRDRPAFERTVAAIIADLAYRLLEVAPPPEEIEHNTEAGPLPGVRLSLDRAKLCKAPGRYDPRFLGKTLPDILDTMALPSVGLVTVERGEWSGSIMPGKRTIVRPTPALAERLTAADLAFPDWGLCPDQEIVLLRASDPSFWDHGALEEYTDTDDTERLRDEMRRINAHLDRADITVLKDDPELARINPALRRMQRVFNRSSFEMGGRLGGPYFWASMRRAERQAIRIDGHPTVTLDYSSMGTRLLYARAGVVPPAGDLYDLDAFGPAYRDGVKKFASATLFKTGRPTRMPQGMAELFPWATSVATVAAAWERKHRALLDAPWRAGGQYDEQRTGYLYRNLGHRLMRTESDILVRVILDLNACGITALGLHDAVIVAQPHAETARSVMLSVYSEVTGQTIPVSLE